MIKQSIRRRIVSIAVGLIVLMVATSVLSMVMVGRVAHLLDELTARYIPANAHLTRITVTGRGTPPHGDCENAGAAR